MMRHLQFLIFIYGLVFAQVKFYHECGEKEGTEVWQVSKNLKLEKLNSESIESITFNRDSPYIVLRTENSPITSTENNTEINKNVKKKWLRCFIGWASEEVTPYTYYIYYLFSNESIMASEIDLTVHSVAQLFKYVQNRSRKDVTIIKETHYYESDEFLKLFPHISEQRKKKTEEWSKTKKSKFEGSVFLSKLYKLTMTDIMQIPPNTNNLNNSDAFVVDANTNLIGISTKNENLKKYTNNFINFIKRLRSKNVETMIVETFNDLLSFDKGKNEITENQRKEIEEHYELLEYKNNYLRQHINTNKSKELDSHLIEANRQYILINHEMKTILVHITPNLGIDTVRFILKLGETLLSEYSDRNYQLSIVQPHKPNVSFIIAFKNLIEYIMNDTSTKELDKFIKKSKKK